MKSKFSIALAGLVITAFFYACETEDIKSQLQDTNNNNNPIDTSGNTTVGFIINEVLYDPPSGVAGDANGDGTRDANDDEFIEFYNGTPSDLDISGYKITVDNGGTDSLDRHIFPAGSIIPSAKGLLVFGGGTPTGSFGNSVFQTASEGALNLNNSGEIVTLYDTSGAMVLTFDIFPLSDNPNESYTRDPDLTGAFVQHNDISPVLFSPGTKVDGTSF